MTKKKSEYGFINLRPGDGYKITRRGVRVPPGNVTRILNTKWGNLVRQLNVDKSSVILIQRPKDQSWEAFDEATNALADEIGARTGADQVLIGVENLKDFQQVTQEQMAEIGWVRAESVLAYMEESIDEINKRMAEEEE